MTGGGDDKEEEPLDVYSVSFIVWPLRNPSDSVDFVNGLDSVDSVNCVGAGLEGRRYKVASFESPPNANAELIDAEAEVANDE